jgi:16S rRNA (cytosine967-C5)-methyltransferase
MANARDLAAELLLAQDRQGLWVSVGLEAARSQLADPRDRGLLTEMALGCVRQQGTLDAVLASFSSRPVPKLDPALRVALRLGLYQILFLERVPPHAAVDQTMRWARKRAGAKRAGFVNAVLRSVLRDLQGDAEGAEDLRRDVPREDGSALRFGKTVFVDPQRHPHENLGQRFSMPTWLVARWQAAWGAERCAEVLRAACTRPPLSLRPRRGRAALTSALDEYGIDHEDVSESEGVLLRSGEGVVGTLLEEGLAAVQDLTSQRVAPLLAPQEGEDLLDLCAAPGGKALHLADLLGRGTLTACDVDPDKLKALTGLTPLMGEVVYRVHPLPETGALPLPHGGYDGILIDAPCSNTGVLRRRVEARWRLDPEDFAALATIQLSLLERSLPLLRAGGRIVYSTCSLESEENEDVVAAFCAAHPEFHAEPAYREWPGRDADGGCGFVLRRA